MARVAPREFRWMTIVGILYIILCGVLLLLNMPSSNIEPVSSVAMQGQGPKSVSLMASRARSTSGKLNRLMSLLLSQSFLEHGIKVKWIRERITRLSYSWEKAQADLHSKKPSLFTDRQNILLFPGLLTEYSAYDFANNAFKGGYLGELVQWSDLIATLHLLGHDVTLLTSRKQLTERVPLDEDVFDLVFTDYLGLFGLRDSQHFYLYKCKIRVLDSFGTEALFNFRTLDFSARNGSDMFNNWMFEELRQFWTLFPHTPDNSFLGFVVEAPPPSKPGRDVVRKNQGVLYGKDGRYLYGKEDFIAVIAMIAEVHATFKEVKSNRIPRHIVNHGVLKAAELQRLLHESKIFIGMGFPYDGPGPFEALANGCSFIQPRFDPPHSGKNTNFFGGKPTSRELTSQVPYLEHFVGEPYVYTVDMKNESAVKRAVYEILERKHFDSFIPHEFTQKGMMDRVGTYISHQDLCDGPDLARGRPATASSVLHNDDHTPSHTPGEAVDGLLTRETCFWSDSGSSHWWSVDLGQDVSLRKIRITNTYEWILAKAWGNIFMAPFVVTLSDSEGRRVASKRFTDNKIFYIWEDINERARYVRLDSLYYDSPRYFVVCSVEVYGSSSERPPWPPLSLLSMKVSKAGESCKALCRDNEMVCEPAFFRALNSLKTLKDVFHCNSTKTISSKYVDFLPAYSIEKDDHLGLPANVCAANEYSMLLSCSGHHRNYSRLCPCRQFTKGQLAIPPTI